MTLQEKIASIDVNKISDNAKAYIEKVKKVAQTDVDRAETLIDGLIAKITIEKPDAIKSEQKISKAEAQEKLAKVKQMKKAKMPALDKLKTDVKKQYPSWDDDKVETLAKIRLQAMEDRQKSIDTMIENLEKTTMYQGAPTSRANIDYVAPKEPNRIMRQRMLNKDAKTGAITEADEIRMSGKKFKRKSPTYGKRGGAKRPYYYEYRMNRRDVDSKVMLAHGGMLHGDDMNPKDYLLIKAKMRADSNEDVTFVVAKSELNKISRRVAGNVREKARAFVDVYDDMNDLYQYEFVDVITTPKDVKNYIQGHNHTHYSIKKVSGTPEYLGEMGDSIAHYGFTVHKTGHYAEGGIVGSFNLKEDRSDEWQNETGQYLIVDMGEEFQAFDLWQEHNPEDSVIASDEDFDSLVEKIYEYNAEEYGEKYAKGGMVVIEDFGDQFSIVDESGQTIETDFETYEEAAAYAEDSGYEIVQSFNYAKGGSTEITAPVSTRISNAEINQFIDYVDAFYGKNGIYASDLNGGYSKQEIKSAVMRYINALNRNRTWGHGDSFDRELVREYLTNPNLEMEVNEVNLFAKGGMTKNDLSKSSKNRQGISKNTTYVPNANVKELFVVLKGQTKKLSGADIVNGIYVKKASFKTKNTVSTTNAKQLFDEIVKKSKTYDWDVEIGFTENDIASMLSAGLSESEIKEAFYGSDFSSFIKADTNFGSTTNGILASYGDYQKRMIESIIENAKNNLFEVGMKYPNFKWDAIIKKYDISTTPVIYKTDDYYYEIFVGKGVTIGHTIRRKDWNGNWESEGNEIVNPSIVNNYQTERDYFAGFNGGYWGMITRSKTIADDILKTLLSQSRGYVKDLEVFLNRLGGIGGQEVLASKIKFAKGGGVEERIGDFWIYPELDRKKAKEFPYNVTNREGAILYRAVSKKDATLWINERGGIDKFTKYSKGGGVSIPNAEKMFHLPMEMAIYVPSTYDVDKKVSRSEMNARINEVEKYLAETFGGFTSGEKEGGYLSSQNRIVTEKVVPVTAFASKDDFNKKKSQLVNKMSIWAKKWGQEAIGFEFEGDLYYVPQKFKKGGRLTAHYIPQGNIAELKTIFGETFKGKDLLDGAYAKRKPKTPKMVRQYFEDEAYEYASGGLTGMSGNAKLMIEFISADVYEDDYEEGEGKYVNGWNHNEAKGTIVKASELVKWLHDNYYLPEDKSAYALSDGKIFTSMLVDENNDEASESEKDAWKKGKMKLYRANYSIGVKYVSTTDLDDETLSEMTGIGFYKEGGSVKTAPRTVSRETKAIIDLIKPAEIVHKTNNYIKYLDEDGNYHEMSRDAEGVWHKMMPESNAPRISRTMFEEETYEYADGGEIEEEKFRYKDFYRAQGGIKFETEADALKFIKNTKPYVRKQLKEGNLVLVFNGKEYFIGEKIKVENEYAKGGKAGDRYFVAQENGILGVFAGSDAYSVQVNKGDEFVTVGDQDNASWWYVKKVNKSRTSMSEENTWEATTKRVNVDWDKLILTFPKGDKMIYAEMKEKYAKGGNVNDLVLNEGERIIGYQDNGYYMVFDNVKDSTYYVHPKHGKRLTQEEYLRKEYPRPYGSMGYYYEIKKDGNFYTVEFYNQNGKYHWGKEGFTSKEDAEKYAETYSKFAKGGNIGFEELSDKVAARYAGKSVKPEYQDEYGKRYDRSEAKEVGDKVAGMVYWKQQRAKKANGGYAGTGGTMDSSMGDDPMIGGTMASSMFAKGGSVDGFTLVYETWSKMMGGNGISGTIRTMPENYYVATIDEKGNIEFQGLEVNTRNIDKEKVKRLWETNSIPKSMFAKGGAIKREENYLLGYEPYFEKHVQIAAINDMNKTVRPTHGYFPNHPLAKKAISWAKRNGYEYVADGKKY